VSLAGIQTKLSTSYLG